MTARAPTAVALVLWLVACALVAGCLSASLALRHDPATAGWPLVQWALASVGALLVARIPRHRMGWVLSATGLGFLVQAAGYRYAALGHEVEGLPGVGAAAWLGGVMSVPGMLLLVVFVPLLFPSGHLPSPRWRWLSRATVVVGVVALPALALRPGPVENLPVDNPLGVAALAGVGDFVWDWGFPLVALLGLAALGSLFVRFRRADDTERLQIKWVAFAFGVMISYTTGWAVVDMAFGIPDAGGAVGDLVAVLLAGLLPVAIGLAVLRYRLYDIERLVSRTVTYGLLTAVLVGVYSAAVLLLAPVVGRGSDLAVAAATLSAAALFAPARRRIQHAVDRRFNRARYDAEQVVAASRDRLRDEVALEQVATELRGAVGATVQPAASTLWLREWAAAR